MPKAIEIATTPTLVSPGGSRKFISLINESDTTIYVSYDGSRGELTPANGHPIEPGDYLCLVNDGTVKAFTGAIEAIHDGAGTKILRVQEP